MRSWLWFLGGGLLGAAWQGRRPEPVPEPAPSAPAPAPAPSSDSEGEYVRKLAELAGLSREEALQQLLEEERARQRRHIEAVGRAEWDRLAGARIAEAMQRVVVQNAHDASIVTLQLPADEYKGRIIGKEGRNLRLFESLTGVDVIIDDSPQCVSLSCFDPARREVARLALQRLIDDGRFQASRIEDAVQRAQGQLEEVLKERAQQALSSLGLRSFHPELIRALGRLALRSSYRQNVLDHSVEVAWLCAQLAADLGGDVEVARRAGLLHDVGKGMVGENGPHALLGAKLCKRLGESAAVCHAVEAHHEDVPQTSLEATLVQVADAISAARPGARRENAQFYLERLETLEKLGLALEGVQDCHVVQAGREVRVFVRPEQVDDAGCMQLADQLARTIESSLTTPGPVRVKVIRQFETSGRGKG